MFIHSIHQYPWNNGWNNAIAWLIKMCRRGEKMNNDQADRLSSINIALVLCITVSAWIAAIPALIMVISVAAQPLALLRADRTSFSFLGAGLGIILVAIRGSLMFFRQFEQISSRALALFYGLCGLTLGCAADFMLAVDL
jgi:hypothetical protein